MTLTLVVISFNGRPPDSPARMAFGIGVGTLGRQPGNTMVLPDPERSISRLQAEIIGTPSGQFVLRNVSTAVEMAVGSSTLRHGDSAVLANDDLIRLGHYVLRVVLLDAGAPATVAPMAPASRTPDPTLADWLPPVAAPPLRDPASAAPWETVFGELQPPSVDPMDLFAPSSSEPPAPAVPSPARLPDDWDPFDLSDLAMRAPPPAQRPAPSQPPVPTMAPAPQPAPAAPPANAPERVEMSALVPATVQPAQAFRIEVFLGPDGTLLAALDERLATDADRRAAAVQPLCTPLAPGTRIELTLECAAAQRVAPTTLALIWQGQTVSVNFQVLPPKRAAGPSLLVDVNVFADGVCIGHLPITLPYAQEAPGPVAPAGRPSPVGFEPHRRVFMSYSSDDRAAVLEATRVLRRFGIEAFMDRLSLEGGEDWEPRLYREIDACDAFMLFWSAAAARSAWVLKETQCALSRQRSSAARRPKIVTHLLGPPPPATPPAGLEALHFNDPLYALWEASRPRAG